MPTAHRASSRCDSARSPQTAERVSAVATPLPQSIAFERLLADLSERFVNLAADKVDAAITESLLRISELLRRRPGRAGPLCTRTTSGHRVTHSAWSQGVAEGSPGSPSRDAVPWVTRKSCAAAAHRFRPTRRPACGSDRGHAHRGSSFKVKAGVVVPLDVDGVIESAIGRGLHACGTHVAAGAGRAPAGARDDLRQCPGAQADESRNSKRPCVSSA